MRRTFVIVFLAWLPTAANAAALNGTVFDSAGDPVVNARVGIATAAPRKGPALFCPSCYLDCSKSAKTDQRGRYQISDLSDSLKFHVLVTATGQESQLTKLIDPRSGPLDIQLSPIPRDMPEARVVHGRVVDDQKHPLGGALVSPSGAKTASKRWYGSVENVEPAVCDEQGHFSMLLPDDFQAVDVEVTANGKAGIIVQLLKPGATDHEISTPTGTRVTGKLVHGGNPVAGLRIAVAQLDRGTERIFIKAVPSTTDDAGHFDFNYLPADQRYAIYTLIGDGASAKRDFVVSTKLFTAKSNNMSRDLGALEVQPALHLHGHIELPPGKSLPSGAKLIVSRDPAWDLIAVPIAADGDFVLDGIPPETYELRVLASGLEIDSIRINYQTRGPQSFGIHLTESMDDLLIPMVKK